MNSQIVASSRPAERPLAARAASIITNVVEDIFASVEVIRDAAVAQHRAASERGMQMGEPDVALIRERVLSLLAEREIAVGMGMIMSPGLLAGQPLRLEWWQRDPDPNTPAWLDVDLNPESVDFYDYVSADWFVVPRTTGRRHVMGPYVDVHGTDRYVLTLTLPVIDGGEFLGVAGADVPVARFEKHVLHELGPMADDIVVVNADDRVVLSSSPRWLTGSLVVSGHSGAAAETEMFKLPSPPWRLLVTSR